MPFWKSLFHIRSPVACNFEFRRKGEIASTLEFFSAFPTRPRHSTDPEAVATNVALGIALSPAMPTHGEENTGEPRLLLQTADPEAKDTWGKNKLR